MSFGISQGGYCNILWLLNVVEMDGEGCGWLHWSAKGERTGFNSAWSGKRSVQASQFLRCNEDSATVQCKPYF